MQNCKQESKLKIKYEQKLGTHFHLKIEGKLETLQSYAKGFDSKAHYVIGISNLNSNSHHRMDLFFVLKKVTTEMQVKKKCSATFGVKFLRLDRYVRENEFGAKIFERLQQPSYDIFKIRKITSKIERATRTRWKRLKCTYKDASKFQANSKLPSASQLPVEVSLEGDFSENFLEPLSAVSGDDVGEDFLGSGELSYKHLSSISTIPVDADENKEFALALALARPVSFEHFKRVVTIKTAPGSAHVIFLKFFSVLARPKKLLFPTR